MIKIIKENFYFFATTLLFIVIGIIIISNIEKGDVIFFLNERRTWQADIFFKLSTKMGEEYVYVFGLLFFLFIRIRYALLIPFTGLMVGIISFLLKLYFAVDRPKEHFVKLGIDDQINFIEGVFVNIGRTSFPSGHTMSAFAVYGLMAFFLWKKRSVGVLLGSIAILVGISRIYLVQHFLEDVVVGGTLGILTAMVIHFFQQRVNLKEGHWLDQRITFSQDKLIVLEAHQPNKK